MDYYLIHKLNGRWIRPTNPQLASAPSISTVNQNPVTRERNGCFNKKWDKPKKISPAIKMRLALASRLMADDNANDIWLMLWMDMCVVA